MKRILISRPSESAHFYDKSGNPQYTVVGSNGKERSTTLREARKYDWYPSVTTILKVASRPGLQRWIQNQVLLAALTLPRIENEPESTWIARVIEDSAQHAKNAAEFGTVVHAAVQGYYDGETIPAELFDVSMPAIIAIQDKYGEPEWKSEQSFAHPLRYGGKVDLCAPGIVIDFKTKAFTERDIKKGLSYDEHVMQLSAYRIGLGLEGSTCANVFISTTVLGLVHIEEYEQNDLLRSWEMFTNLLNFWKLSNKF